MEEAADKYELKRAIKYHNLKRIKNILVNLSTLQVRKELDKQIDGKDFITLALHYKSRKIAIALLLRSLFEHNIWPYQHKDFSWLNLFEFIGNASIEELVERLQYAKPLAQAGDIDLKSLAKNLDYLKVAYLLGAPCDDGKLLGKLILKENQNGPRLLADLVNSKICKKFPLPMNDIVRCAKNYDKEVLNLLDIYPEWHLDTDDHGNNVFHNAITRDPSSVDTFGEVWSLFDRDTTLDLFLQKNDAGEIPIVMYLLKVQQFTFPFNSDIEFFLAIQKLITEDNYTKEFEEIFAKPHIFYNSKKWNSPSHSATILLVFFLTSGCKSEKARQLLQTIAGVDDISLFLHHMDKIGNERVKVSDTHEDSQNLLPLSELPTELNTHIMEHLPPRDLVTYSLANKKFYHLFNQLKNNEQFCKRYLHSFFPPIPELQTTYSKCVSDQFELFPAWRANKYKCIVTNEQQSFRNAVMDENWLVVATNNEVRYWNCHTHTESTVTLEHNASWFRNAVLMSNYDIDSLPMLFDSQYNIITKADGSQNQLHCCQQFTLQFKTAVAIDHRIIACVRNRGTVLIDTEIDTMERVSDLHCTYNPFNDTLVGTDILTKKYHVTDLRTRCVAKYDVDFEIDPWHTTIKFSDEYTMFYEAPDTVGFVDLRNFRKIYSVTNLDWSSVAYSKERAIYKTRNSPLVYSWHLPSKKIEWIAPIEITLVAANSRYLVSEYGIYDYKS